MAMSSLNIDYEKTRTAGRTVQAKASDFKTLLGQISTLNGDLKKSWTGADADSYTNKITEQAQVMNKLQATIQEIGEYLVKVGNAYEEVMKNNKIN